MTTSTNFKTNSIDSIGTTLNIGTTNATSISLDETTTQALTATGGLITPTIQPSYVSYPTQVSSQRALQLFNSVLSVTDNVFGGSATILTVNQISGATPTILTIPLPIGVWSISYTIRFRANNMTLPANFSYIMTTATLAETITYNSITYPKYLGLQAMPCAIQSNNNENRTTFSGNTVITNNVPNTLTLQYAGIFTGSGMRVFGTQPANTVNTFLIATRIA
jgi:hypothetical protein